MFKRIGAAIIPLLLISPTAFAQTAPEPNAGAFASLSPGNQKIADSLYRVEELSPVTGEKPMTRDDIAAAKLSDKGWGVVFKQMKQDGLVTARNLGQVVSHHAAPVAEHPVPTVSSVVVTLGNGRSLVAAGSGRDGGTSGGQTTFAAASHGEGGTSVATAGGHIVAASHGGGHGSGR